MEILYFTEEVDEFCTQIMRSYQDKEFRSVLDVSPLIGRIKSCDVHIYEVEIQREGVDKGKNPSAIFTIRLNKSMSHAEVLAIVSDSPNVYTVEEI